MPSESENLLASYHIVKKISQGGMAEIFEAKDFQGKKVAIKKLRKEFVYDQKFIQLLKSEYETLKKLQHPNFISAYDFFSKDEEHFIVLEFVEGENLKNILNAVRKENKLLPITLALQLALQVIEGLSYLHSMKNVHSDSFPLIHSDLNPNNILVSSSGEVKIIDFSTEQMEENKSGAHVGLGRGILTYMSPEQAKSETLDIRSDIFCVGILLHEMLTGENPFFDKHPLNAYLKLTHKIINPETLPADLDFKLKEILCKTLEKKPVDRYPSMQELQNEIQKYLATHASSSRKEMAQYLSKLNFSQEVLPKESSLTPVPSSPIQVAKGEPITPYILLDLIGQGELTYIYKSKFPLNGKTVALKKLKDEYLNEAKFVCTLDAEARILSQLHHPNILEFYDYISNEEAHYLALEYVEGWNLRHIIDQHQRHGLKMPLWLSIWIMKELCDTLYYLHNAQDEKEKSLQIVHGDINPKNILLSKTGYFKLIDFTISQSKEFKIGSEERIGKGTLSYMAPEQAFKQSMDSRSDLFSTGVVFYELLTGEKPFSGKDKFEVEKNLKSYEISPENLPQQIDPLLKTILVKSLDKNPQNRFQNTETFSEAITSFMKNNHLSVTKENVAQYLNSYLSSG